MASCNPITFQNVTRLQFQAVRARAVAEATGVQNNGDSGSATGPTWLGPVTVSWKYDEPSQSLTLQCTDKPRPLPAAWVNSRIQSLVGSALNA